MGKKNRNKKDLLINKNRRISFLLMVRLRLLPKHSNPILLLEHLLLVGTVRLLLNKSLQLFDQMEVYVVVL